MGLGPLGIKIVNLINERQGVKVTRAVDCDPRLTGQDLGVVCGGKPSGIKIVSSIKELNRKDFDVVILSTVSDMRRIAPQIEDIVALGVPVISTCEELSCPWRISPRIAGRIDCAAKNANVAVLGTGVNPGFLMDLLPVALTAVSQRVDKIKVSRIQNAEFRRIPFQQKIGAGLSLEEFEKEAPGRNAAPCRADGVDVYGCRQNGLETGTHRGRTVPDCRGKRDQDCRYHHQAGFCRRSTADRPRHCQRRGKDNHDFPGGDRRTRSLRPG